jgi:putative copper resistance protein D
VTDSLTIGIRLILYADLMLLFGLPMFALYGLTNAGRQAKSLPRLRPLLIGLAIAALLASIAWLAEASASMAGTPVTAVDRATLQLVVTQTPVGAAWQVRIAALAATVALAAMPRSGTGAPILVATSLTGGVALATLAWAGHGASGEGPSGWLQLGADVVHLLAAGIWVGALAAFFLMLVRPRATASTAHIAAAVRALQRFAAVGTIVVGLLIATGLINSLMLVGLANLPTLPTTVYGQLLIAKLALFLGMLFLAASNRFRLTPTLARAGPDGSTHEAVTALRRSVVLEVSAAFLILALVAWLGTLAAPMSAGGG